MNLEHLQIALAERRKARKKWTARRRAFWRGFRKAFRADILGLSVAAGIAIYLVYS